MQGRCSISHFLCDIDDWRASAIILMGYIRLVYFIIINDILECTHYGGLF